jgi:tetratricopeptide (TPR) repeat protein
MVSSRFSLRFLSRLCFAAVLLACLAGIRPVARADDSSNQPPPELEDKTQEGLKNLQAIVDAAETATHNGESEDAAQKWQQACDLLEGLIPQTKEGSYDRWVVEDTLAKILWQGRNDPDDAIGHFLAAEQILETHPNFVASEKDRLDHIKWIGQAYYQKAIAIKHDPAAVHEAYAQSLRYMQQYLSATPQPDPQDEMLYSMLLYSQATVDPKNPDRAMLAEAEKSTRLALTLSTHPRPDLYTLLIAELMEENNYREAADYIELLITLKPTQKDLWEQLWQIYNQLASDAANHNDHAMEREYLARAILAMERAQRLGYLSKPSDNYNLVTLYSTAGQTQTAVKLLDKGLHDGAIDSTPLNWEYLANFYLQIDKPNEAISAMKDAIERFPDDSDLYLEVAQFETQVLNTQASFTYAKEAVEHNHFTRTKKWQANQMVAYAAYELQKLDDALEAVNAAIREAPREARSTKADLVRFRQAIEAAIKQRDILKKNSVS